MKKLITGVLLVCTEFAMAAGPLDGIYYCDVYLYGYQYPSYVTLSGHADGTTVFTVAAVSPSTTFYGFGIGSATSTSFSGNTSFGRPFSFSANTLFGTMTGSIGVVWGGSAVNATASCGKIW